MCVCVRVRARRCMLSLLRIFMHAHTVEMLETLGRRCQDVWPAAADEILSGSTDLRSQTETLTEVVPNSVEETMRILDENLPPCAYAYMETRPPTSLFPSCSPFFLS